MKVYLFNVESGLYEGEDYRDTNEVVESDGITCTAPPDNKPGCAPVYDRAIGQWNLFSITDLNGKGKDND